jgi:hypothetical protein
MRKSTAAPNTTWNNVGSQEPLDKLTALMPSSNASLLRPAEGACAFNSSMDAANSEYVLSSLRQLMYANRQNATVATTF